MTDTLVDVLKAEFRGLSSDVQGMRDDIRAMSGKLERIAVIEERYNNQSQAIERAFGAIASLEKDHTDHMADAIEKRATYDRAMWVATGFIAAVSVGWTVFGVHLTKTVEETSKAVTLMRVHVETDEITKAEKVRELAKQINEVDP